MARLLKHTLMFALLLALACGCSSEEGAGGEMPANATQVSFILRLSDESEGTRAAWSNGYLNDDGTEYDKRINPDDLKVALYHTNGTTFAANVNIVTYHELASQEGEYEFIGTVETAAGTELSSGDYKIMVFANCQISGELFQATQLGELTYQYNETDVKSEEQLIPMWGVTTAHLTLEKGKRDDVGPIDLLRAFAKVEILLNDEIRNDYTITSATLSHYNTQGYCLPAGYADVQNTRQLDQENDTNPSFHPYSSASTDLYFSYSEDKKSACLYIPEYENSTNAATISLQLSDGTNETTGTLHFRPYVDGAPTGNAYNIVRNHIYRYTVNVEQGELKVQAAVMPWQLVTSSIGWKPQPITDIPDPFEGKTDYENMLKGNYYMLFPRVEYKNYSVGEDEDDYQTRKMFDDLYDHPQKGDDEARLCYVCRPGYVVGNQYKQDYLKTGSGGARYYFMLTGPKGATWEAHLTNTEDFSFSTTYEEDEFANSEYEQGIFKVTHGIARSKPYIIQIVANHNYTGTEKGQTGLETSITKYPNDNKGGEEYFGDEYLTDWGADNWFGHKVIDTEFYITVKLTDGSEYELKINPSFKGLGGLKEEDFYYNDYRRYTGTDTRIWIRQLRAVYKGDFDDMAKDVSPTDKSFEWWRVNPYWRK